MTAAVRTACLLAILSGFALSSYSQDTLFMLKGNRIPGKLISNDNIDVKFEALKQSGRTKSITLPAHEVFSIHGANGETVVYKENPMQGDWMSVEDARLNMMGAYNAREKYNGWWTFGAAFGTSLGVSILDTWLWKGRVAGDTTGLRPGMFGDPRGPSLFTLLVPVAFSATISLPNYPVHSKRVINKDLMTHQPFLRGYDRVARGKRWIKSLTGGFSGLAAGIGLYYLFRKN